MKLPLLVGARPRYVKEGPWVPLNEGEWQVTASHVDTQISIESALGPVIPLHSGAFLRVVGKTSVRALIVKAGTEPSIEVSAELL